MKAYAFRIPVILCSPFRGDRSRNAAYLRACLRDSYERGEAPHASHAIGPIALNDENEAERAAGLQAEIAWIPGASAVIAYVDLGVSDGMQGAMDYAARIGKRVETRKIGGVWAKPQGPDLFAPIQSQRDYCAACGYLGEPGNFIRGTRCKCGAFLRRVNHDFEAP